MKKKLGLTLAAVAMVGTLAVGGTLAWFTDTETAINAVTTGSVNIDLQESNDEGKTWVSSKGDQDATLTYDNVSAGSNLNKRAKVANIGKNSILLRAKVVVTLDGQDWPADIERPMVVSFSPNWIKDDTEEGVYYYNDVVGKGDTTDELMKALVIPKTWDNSMTNKKVDVKIVVDAIQSENITDKTVDFSVEEMRNFFVDKTIQDAEERSMLVEE